MTPRKPVTDWAIDWDHLDPRWREDPFPIWDELRRSCPIAHTERYQGAYLPTRYEDVRAIANDSMHFSSRRVIVREVRPEPPIPSPPITSDPPHHKPYKQLLLPPFTAEAVTKLEPKARAICNELMDKFIATGHCDAAQGGDGAQRRLHIKEVQTMPKARKTQTRKPAAPSPRKTARKSAKPTKMQKPAAKTAASQASKVRSPAAPARPSKKTAIVALLGRPDGAAIGDLTKATGWQVHSVRAALTGLRKEGKEVVRSKDESGVTHYRLCAIA